MATKWQNIQYQLDAWCKEYGINPELVKFYGWEDLNHDGKFVLGNETEYPSGWSAIRLGKNFEDRSLGWLELSVLWHEYCHAECYLEDMKGNSHDDTWRAKKNRKTKYVIGDAIAKLVYPFL